jgi:glycosyltransferase involved in cell wall biosynthesis
MRLLLDLQAVQAAARYRGLGRYSLECAAALARLPEVDETLIILNDGLSGRSLLESRRLIRSRIADCSIHVFEVPWPGMSDARDVRAQQDAELVRDQFIQELAPDAVVVCSLFSSPFESVVSVPPKGTRPPTAVIAYDMLPLTDPDSSLPPIDAGWYQHRLASLKNADVLLCISDFTAAEVRRLLGTECPPTQTIWGSGFTMDEVHAGRRRGVLVVGGDGRRKNEAATIRAFASLPPDLRAAHPLTVLGRQTYPDLDPGKIAEECGLRPNEYAIVSEEISDAELGRRYAEAKVLAMPSRGEGLGMPVLEAWRHGTPAIASDVTSLPQLIDDDRWVFSPDDVGRQAEIIERL